MLFKRFLRKAVEGERGDGALEPRGAVRPHGQWEQHQPVKSSPSTQIKCLFIHHYFCVRLGLELGGDGRNTEIKSERGRWTPAPSPGTILHGIAGGQSD